MLTIIDTTLNQTFGQVAVQRRRNDKQTNGLPTEYCMIDESQAGIDSRVITFVNTNVFFRTQIKTLTLEVCGFHKFLARNNISQR
jgi:hypothetical protein